MPNWCCTNIIISHPDEGKVKELFERIKDWTSRDCYENDFGHGWLGNVLGNSGIAKWDEEKDGMFTEKGEYIYCRGSITDLSFEGGAIHIWQEDAWSPLVKLWSLVLEKYLPDADITFSAEEPGCGVYATNDPCIEGSYYVDVWETPDEFKDETSMYDAEESDVIEFCQRVLHTDEDDIKKLLDMASELDWVAIHQWYHKEIEDCA
jgi:hypothetical protein